MTPTRSTTAPLEVLLTFVLLLVAPSATAGFLDPNDFTSLAPILAPTATLEIDTGPEGGAAPTLSVDGGAALVGVVDDQDGLAQPGTVSEIAVFSFDDVAIPPGVAVTIMGERAIALLSKSNLLVQSDIDVSSRSINYGSTIGSGGCDQLMAGFAFALPPAAGGPGGFAGGGLVGGTEASSWEDALAPAQGPGATSYYFSDSEQGTGGLGASFGTAGSSNFTCGAGATCPVIGPVYGDLRQTLQGGSGVDAALGTLVAIRPLLWLGLTGAGGGGAMELTALGDVQIDGLLESHSTFTTGVFAYGTGGAFRIKGARVTLNGAIRTERRRTDDGAGFSRTTSLASCLPAFDFDTAAAAGFIEEANSAGGGRAFVEAPDGELEIGGLTVPHPFPGVFNTLSGANSQILLALGTGVVRAGESVTATDVHVINANTTAYVTDAFVIEDNGEFLVPPGGESALLDITLEGPSARVAGTGTLTLGRTLTGTGEVQAPLAIVSGGELVVGALDALQLSGTTTSAGRVSVLGGSLSTSQPFTNEGAGRISVLDTTISFPGDGAANDDGLVNEGTLNLVEATIDGDVRSPAGSMINVAGTATFNGLVSGAGTFSGTTNLVVFNGGYSPGDSPAALDFDGDVAFGAGGTFTLELFGLAPGTGHDQVNVAGGVDLDGTVSLVPGGGFTPAVGDSFTLLTWGIRSGEFASVAGVQQAGEVDLGLRYEAGAAVVATVMRGDVNGDGFLDAADTAIVEANQGLATTAYTSGDVDGSGSVDASDSAIVAAAVGGAPSVPSLVPGNLVVLASLLALAGIRRLHRSWTHEEPVDPYPLPADAVQLDVHRLQTDEATRLLQE